MNMYIAKAGYSCGNRLLRHFTVAKTRPTKDQSFFLGTLGWHNLVHPHAAFCLLPQAKQTLWPPHTRGLLTAV